MLRALVVLLFLSLAGVASSQRQHALHSDKDKYYNITLDFDDIRTNSSGIGFHPTDPKEDALIYRTIYLQSFTLTNASSANLSKHDQQCSRSWPNSIFASQKDGFAWPRISLHDLSKPMSEATEEARKGDRTFSLDSVHLKPVGDLPGLRSDTFGIISITMMRLFPDPRKGTLPPEAGYPGIVRGSPLPLFIGHVAGVNILFPPGPSAPFPLKLKKIFGEEFGRHTDVIEITSQAYRKSKDQPVFLPAETLEICLDDIVLEVNDEDTSTGERLVSDSFIRSIRSDGTTIKQGDEEWDLLAHIKFGNQYL